MKVRYNDVEYKVLNKEDGRVYMEDADGGKKDIAESTFEKAEIISEETKNPPVKELTPAQKKKQQNDHLKQKVRFEAFYDGEKYKDDITVTVNGRNFVIQRGKPVNIPLYVYHALEAHERQKAKAAHTSSKFNKTFKGKEKQFV